MVPIFFGLTNFPFFPSILRSIVTLSLRFLLFLTDIFLTYPVFFIIIQYHNFQTLSSIFDKISRLFQSSDQNSQTFHSLDNVLPILGFPDNVGAMNVATNLFVVLHYAHAWKHPCASCWQYFIVSKVYPLLDISSISRTMTP